MEPNRPDIAQENEGQPQPQNDGFSPRAGVTPTQASNTPGETSPTSSMGSSNPVASNEVEPSVVGTGTFAPNGTPVSSGIPPEPSKKKFIIGGVVAAAAVLLIGGGVSAYFLWYQNPQKVITDGLSSFMMSKSGKVSSKMTFKQDSQLASSFTLNVDAQYTAERTQLDMKLNADYQEVKFNLQGGMIYQKDNDLYVKLGGVRDLVEQFYGTQTLPTNTQKLVNMIDDKWIAISEDDIKDTSTEGKEVKACLDTLAGKVDKDKTYVNELSKAYKNNMFIDVKEKLGTKDGNVGYRIQLNQDKFIAYLREAEKGKLYKEVLDCEKKADSGIADDFSIADEVKKSFDKNNSSSNKVDGKVEIWISQFSHQLKAFKISAVDDTSDVSVDTTFDVNAKVNIDKPSESTSFDKVKDAATDAMNELNSEYSYSSSSTTTSYDFNEQTAF